MGTVRKIGRKIDKAIFQPIGNAIEAVLDDPKKLFGVALAVAFPGAGAMLGAQLGLTGTIAQVVGQTIINTAVNGGDIKSAVISAALPIAGKELTNNISSALAASDIPDFVNDIVTQGAVQGATAAVLGKDPLTAFVMGGVNAGTSALIGEISEEMGFDKLPPAAQRAVTSGIAAELTGKNAGDAVAQSLVNSAKSWASSEIAKAKERIQQTKDTYKAETGKELPDSKLDQFIAQKGLEGLAFDSENIASYFDSLPTTTTDQNSEDFVGPRFNFAENVTLPQDLTSEGADQIREDLGLSAGTQTDAGDQYAQANTGTTSDAGGGENAAPFADAKAGIVGYLSDSTGSDTGISRNDDGTYTVYDPSNNLRYAFSSDGSYLGSAYYVDVSLSSGESRPTTKIAEDFIGAFTNSPYAQSFTGTATSGGSDAGASTGALTGPGSNQSTSSGSATADADFWKSIGIEPSTFSDSSPSLSNEELMAIIGYGQAATQPTDGSGKPMYGDVSGEFGGGALNGFSLVSEDGNAKVYENDGFTLIARANGTSVLLDKTDPNPEPIWLDPVDASKLVQSATSETSTSETSTADPSVTAPTDSAGTTATTVDTNDGTTTTGDTVQADTTTTTGGDGATTPTANVTPEQVTQIVNDALQANPGLTEDAVRTIVSDAVATIPNLTSDQVRTIVGEEVAKVPAGITQTDVSDAIETYMTANPGLSKTDVTNAVSAYMEANPGLTAADLDAAVSAATKDLATTAQLTDLQNNLSEEIQAAKDLGLEGDAALQAGLNSLAEKLGVNQEGLLAQLGTTAADLRTQFAADIAASQEATAAEVANTRTALEAAIADAKAAGLEGDAALQTAIESVATDLGTTKEAMLTQLGTTEATLRSEMETGLAGVSAEISDTRQALQDAIKAAQDIGLEGDAALQAAIDSVAADQQTNAADLLTRLGTTEEALRADMEAGLSGVTTSIADTRTALEAAIADAKASGLEGDAALQAAIDSVAADQQTNAADLLTRLGTTEEALRTEFATGLAGVSTEISDTRKALEDAIQAATDIGLEGDAALQAGIDSVAAELNTTKDALLTQLGTTEEALRTEFATGISGLEAQMQEQYNALTDAQKVMADNLTTQGKSLADAITEAKTETAGQIADAETRLTDAIAAAEAAGLSRDEAITAAVESVAAELGTTKADLLTQLGTTEDALRTEFATGIADLETQMQEQYNALTDAQKATADALVAQGKNLSDAIASAQEQTQQQITDLGVEVDARITELMTQGQTYQQATQQAFSEVNAKNKELSGLIGTQGRGANQTDIDALTEMLGGQRATDLSYDVNGDKQITQADIDFLTGVVSGTNTDWKAPVGSAWGATGLYGQIQANELQRQKDIADAAAAAEAQRQADQKAAEEAARQGKIANIISTAARGGQDIKSLQQQLPKMFETTSSPLYATMDYFDPFSDPFSDPFATQKLKMASSTNPADQTKMAAGGYIDDLLAGEMTVDDLLSLLR
jgi:hypothetical protein